MNIEKKYKVIVEVSGGEAKVTSCPDEVQVEIIDWDNLKERLSEEELEELDIATVRIGCKNTLTCLK